MPKIELIGVEKSFGKIRALDSLNIVVEDGEYFCLLGPTGAGKTTTLKVAAGLVKPDGGRVLVAGNEVTGLQPEERDVTYMSQSFDLFTHIDVLSNVAYGPTMRGLDRTDAEEVGMGFLRLVHLEGRASSMPTELSGGMQQRVALARALSSGRSVLLFDEPLASLDAKLRVELRLELKRLAKEQRTTVVHVTHDQEEALLLADRLAIIRRGTIVQVGTPHEVYSNPANIFVANFIGEFNFLEVRVSRVHGDHCTVTAFDGMELSGLCKGAKVGRRAVLAIRSENVRLDPRMDVSGNILQGIVREARFLGYYAHLSVDVGTVPIACRVFYGEMEQIPPTRGKRVSVYLPPEACVVYSYPEAGLLKELEVI